MLGRLLSSRYRIVRILGSGGFGHAYVTEDTQRPGNPLCVLKHLSFASLNPAILRQARRMFLAEAETLEKLGRHEQIPQLLAYFEEDEEFYLVQEFIEGHPLNEELTLGFQFSEAQVIELLEEVLEILEFVHAHGVIHRDLKPENLIRREYDRKIFLIDFGAVKNIAQPVADDSKTTQMSMPVYTSGYAASEQCLGKPRFSSDIYALGVIGIQALTGARPSQLPQDPNTCELIWRDRIEVRNELAIVLEKMTKFHFSQRYSSATEALEALKALKDAPIQTQAPLSKFDAVRRSPQQQQQQSQRRATGWRLPLTIGAGIGATASVALATWTISRTFSPPPSSSYPQGIATASPVLNQISFGEKVLTPGITAPIKQEAADQLTAGNLPLAIALLEKARHSKPSDPETLIYLNNVRIGDKKSYTIGVVVPLSTQPSTSAEVLRGVAQAQTQVNQSGGINGVQLKVAIATDNSKPELAQQIAASFAADPNLLGVVGHGTSDTTLAAAKIYESEELVAISPISSAVQLSGFSPYLFRTMPSDQVPAKKLTEYMVTQLKKRKAAVFFNSASTYSKSLKDAFKDALYYSGKGQVIEEIDLSKPDFNPVESVEEVGKKGAEVIMLAPNQELFERTLLVVDANQNRLPLLAGDAFYLPKTLQVGGKSVSGMTLAVPAYQADIDRSPFQKQAKTLWGDRVNWRTVLSYDAAQALIGAIQQSPTRNGIRRVLSDPKFSVMGALHPVRFSTKGDRPMELAIVKVMPTRSSKKFEFKSVSNPTAK
jgi:ABC-type branched-subunit amino acid transport system substrate-binding protein/predicted Ser/Thr protein kinase